MFDVNNTAVAIGGLVYIGLAMLWYSPAMFGKQWMELAGRTEEDMPEKSSAMFQAYMLGLIYSFVLAMFIKAFGATNFVDGAIIAFWAWLGFSATGQYSAVLWAKMPLKLYLINVSYLLVTLVLIGGMLGAWQ